MDADGLKKLLNGVVRGDVSIAEAVEAISMPPYVDCHVAKVDTHRALRQGFPEVILGEGKTAEQLAAIIGAQSKHAGPILATRVDEQKAAEALKLRPGGKYDRVSRTLVYKKGRIARRGKGLILVISAGTSDIPVAEEAAVTAELMGNRVERLYDVGVAGIHRLLGNSKLIRTARVLIVVAGMEGALASVVGGLVARPVIAVPTSVGYGASFGGVTALLGMLNSCAANVAVVNIDNGFGAAYVAGLINRL